MAVVVMHLRKGVETCEKFDAWLALEVTQRTHEIEKVALRLRQRSVLIHGQFKPSDVTCSIASFLGGGTGPGPLSADVYPSPTDAKIVGRCRG